MTTSKHHYNLSYPLDPSRNTSNINLSKQRQFGRIVGAMLLLVALLSTLSPMTAGAASDSRGGCSASVTNTASLNAAIACFNAETSGKHTITLANDITLTASSSDIDNATMAQLTISGAGIFTLDGDNSWIPLDIDDGHVTVDGLTISNGQTFSNGAGIRNEGTLTINNSTISDNSASSISTGGGVGGGIYNDGLLTVNNSTFSNNSSDAGGAIYNSSSGILTVTDSMFADNSANNNNFGVGGAIYNQGRVTVSNSTLSDNSADVGGGIHNGSFGTLTVSNSTLSGNSADADSFLGNGGAISNVGTMMVSNSTLSGNSTASGGAGAGIYSEGTLTVNNSTLSGNSAGSAGGIYNKGILTVINSTLSGNSADSGAGGIFNFHTAEAIIKNSIVANSLVTFGTGSPGADCSGTATLIFEDSLIEDPGATCDVSGNLTGDPQLAALAANGGPTLTHAIVAGSAVHNAGDYANCNSDADQRGYLRHDGYCDIGAYEISSGPCAATHNNGTTEFYALNASAVRSAVALASAGSIVKVAGTCVGVATVTVSAGKLDQTVYIDKSLTVEGGYTPRNWMTAADSSRFPTLLDANGQGRVVVLDDAASSGAMQVTLNHLTLQNGVANSAGIAPFNELGGGVFVGTNVVLTLDQSSVLNNSGHSGGGGIRVMPDAEAWVSNSTLAGNSAGSSGGAISNNGTLTVNNSTLLANTSSFGNGGGIFNGSSFSNAGIATVSNSTLSANSAGGFAGSGGGIYNAGTVTVSNSTLSGNSVDSTAGSGGGIYNASSATVENSIIANSFVNGSSSGADCSGTASPTFQSSLIENASGNCNVSGNLTGDPLLAVLADNGGPTLTHALQSGSDAIDAADDSLCYASPIDAVDQRGYFRHDRQCDIGAFELSMAPCAATHDNGATTSYSLDASAVETAVAAASAGGTVKLAGTCVGVHAEEDAVSDGTIMQTVYIDKSLTVEGGFTPRNWAAAANSDRYPTVLDANGQGRVVVLDDVSSSGTIQVTLNHLTLQNGLANSPGIGPFNELGGGIYVGATVMLTLDQSRVLNNRGRSGAGIHVMTNADATVNNSSLAGNSAELYGGGIYNGSGGTMIVNNSTLAGNLANLTGGGIDNYGTVTVNNSTLSSNSAYGSFGIGGGIYSEGTVTASNSTLSGNSATFRGGGIYNVGTATIRNSIIANSKVAGGSTDADCDANTSPTFQDSLIENADANCNVSGNLTDDPLLAPLADNGGATLTHALQSGSEAIDKANVGVCNASPISAVDQRGYSRDGGLCDIGAFELSGAVPTAVAMTGQQVSQSQQGLAMLLVALLLPLTAGWLHKQRQQ